MQGIRYDPSEYVYDAWFLTTDVAISKELLQKALSTVVKDTYNMVSVDGDTSTNDTVLLLANGAAGNDELTEENEDYQTFWMRCSMSIPVWQRKLPETEREQPHYLK